MAEVRRLDAVCAYVRLTRAGFLRRSVAFMDSALVLEEIARLEAQQGALTPEQQATREEATATMVDLLASMHPKPIVPMSAN